MKLEYKLQKDEVIDILGQVGFDRDVSEKRLAIYKSGYVPESRIKSIVEDLELKRQLKETTFMIVSKKNYSQKRSYQNPEDKKQKQIKTGLVILVGATLGLILTMTSLAIYDKVKENISNEKTSNSFIEAQQFLHDYYPERYYKQFDNLDD